MKHSFLILLLFSTYTHAQLTVANIDSSKLPKKIKYTGHIVNAVCWKDSMGMNYVLTTETGEYRSTDKNGESFKNAALYVYHYIKRSDSIQLLWRIYDYSTDCPFDVSVSFKDKAFNVTDLDHNGVAEVWVLYEIQCTSDISPPPTKIIMYEGMKKYAMRGEGRVRIKKEDYGGGTYTFDEAFKKGPTLFAKFGAELWKKYNTRQY